MTLMCSLNFVSSTNNVKGGPGSTWLNSHLIQARWQLSMSKRSLSYQRCKRRSTLSALPKLPNPSATILSVHRRVSLTPPLNAAHAKPFHFPHPTYIFILACPLYTFSSFFTHPLQILVYLI